MHLTVRHCTILHYTALYCTTLHDTALYCTILHYTAPYYTMLHHTALYCIILHHTAPHSLDYTTSHTPSLHYTAGCGSPHVAGCGNPHLVVILPNFVAVVTYLDDPSAMIQGLSSLFPRLVTTATKAGTTTTNWRLLQLRETRLGIIATVELVRSVNSLLKLVV